MELEARRFARRVLTLHAALLLLLVIVVGVAVQLLYASARGQAIEQAKRTQELLARQTGLGIENYYESVASVLNLMQPAHTDSDPLARLSGLGDAAWASIQDKASLLVVIDPAADMKVIRVIGRKDDAPTPAPADIVAASRAWLDTVQSRCVSPYVRLPNHGGAHVVAVPMRGSGGLLMAAVVPVSSLERDVLASINKSPTTSAAVVDDAGVFISAALPAAVGRNVDEFEHPRTRTLAQKYRSMKIAGTEVFDQHESMGDVTFKPGMSTIQPVNVLGTTWSVIVSSDLGEVDKVVKPLFRGAMIWAAFVMLAVLGLLASTAFQLIRGRMRIERMQREVLSREVADARDIQLQWLPKGNFVTQSMEIAAMNVPATHISGDFYNWFDLDDGRTVVTIGDVTGHGMAAAFLMATTQLLVRNIMPRVSSPGDCLTELNRQLCPHTFNGQFVTLLILVFNPQRCTVDIATAGHQAPLVGRGGMFESLELEPQLVLGIDESSEYPTQRFDISPGDSIVLYTDGVTDAQRPDGQRFSTEGLAASLFGKFTSAEAIIDALRAAVDDFREGRDLADDLTLVAIQLHPQDVPTERGDTAQAVVTAADA